MKIGIDIDNTITTTLPIVKEYCKRYNDTVVKRGLKMNEKGFNTHNIYDWTYEEELDFCHKYLAEAVLQATMKEDAVEIIKKLKKEHEIFIITARKKPEFSDPYALSKDFLDKNGVVYDHLIVGCENKDEFCKENGLAVMLDDEPHNIMSISKSIPVIAFVGPQNEECIGNNIYRVSNWNEIPELIERFKNENRN